MRGMFLSVRLLWYWLLEYITLTPKKYNAIEHKLECLLWFATGGMYSKSSYRLCDMYQMVADHIEECCQEAVNDSVAHGRWIKAECSEKNGDSNCSVCGRLDWHDCNYCPNCGAKMDGERKDNG